jgi:hypothetical protein
LSYLDLVKRHSAVRAHDASTTHEFPSTPTLPAPVVSGAPQGTKSTSRITVISTPFQAKHLLQVCCAMVFYPLTQRVILFKNRHEPIHPICTARHIPNPEMDAQCPLHRPLDPHQRPPRCTSRILAATAVLTGHLGGLCFQPRQLRRSRISTARRVRRGGESGFSQA